MAGMNKVILIGNLGKSPEITTTNSGMQIAKFSIATSDGRPGNDGTVKTEWHNITSFGKTAEYIGKYIKKGATVCVEGRIQYGKYENKEGNTVYTTDIMCNNFVNLTKKESTGNQSYEQPKQRQQPQQFNVDYQQADPLQFPF